jgi:glycerol-3-phosphate acyltransferase PlsY
VEIAVRIVLAIGVAYLVGGIPFGVIVARFIYHEDITKLGSGNTGSTNVYRVLGWKAALPVAVLDIGKGSVAAALAAFVFADPAWGRNAMDLLVVMSGVTAMLGHMYSPYFKLRGGKGIATAGGAILVLMPKTFPVLLVIFVGVILIWRVVSIASMAAALVFPVAIAALYPARPVLLLFALCAVPLVVWAHRSNIGRLMRDEEPKITIGRRMGTSGSGGRKDDA